MPEALIVGLLVVILGNQIYIERTVACIKRGNKYLEKQLEHLQGVVESLRR